MENDMHLSFGLHEQETETLSNYVDCVSLDTGGRIGYDHSHRTCRIDKVLVDGISKPQHTPNLCTNTQGISL